MKKLFHLLVLLVLSGSLVQAVAQGTAFTYQGRLNDGSNPANGNYDLRFAVYNAASGGSLAGWPVTNAATAVSNGLFTVTLDFGSGVFDGNARWLDIGVRTNGPGSPGFTTLNPRQALTPAPYAIQAATAVSATTAASVPASGIGPGTATINISGYAITASNLASTATLTSGQVASAGTLSNNIAGNAASATAVVGQLLFGNLVHAPQTIATLLAGNPATSAPFRLVMFGDSLAAQKVTAYRTYFQQKAGFLGYFHPAGVFTYAGGGTASFIEFTNFVSGYVGTLPDGASAVLAGEATYYFADTVDLLWLSGTNFGQFNVYAQTNIANAYVYLTNIVCASTTMNLGLTTIALPFCGYWNLKIIATNATTKMIGATLRHHVFPGVVIWDFTQGGINWDNFSLCKTNVLAQIGSLLNPDLILVEDTSYSNQWADLAPIVLNPIAATSTNADIVLIEPNVMGAAAEPNNLNQIAAIDQIALTNNWVLYKQHSLWSSWSNAVAFGFMLPDPSNPHPTASGIADEVNSLFRDTGIGTQFIKNYDKGLVVVNYSDNVSQFTLFNERRDSFANELVMRQNFGRAVFLFQDLAGNNAGTFYFDGTSFYLGDAYFNPYFTVNIATALTTVAADLNVAGNGGNGVAIRAQNGRSINASGAVNANSVVVTNNLTVNGILSGNGSGLTNIPLSAITNAGTAAGSSTNQFLASGLGGNKDGSGLTFTNAAGASFRLIVNSSTNGFNFVPR